jgi:hypothetical protein
MPDELNDSVSYLRALKQYSQPLENEVSRRSADVEPAGPASDRLPASEKRRSPRYKCEGSAEIRSEGCDVRTWATFTDVSLHGCYVEAQATYPVGTVLGLKLEASGVRVETKGTVRVTYPYLGMGIAFTDTSEESTVRLKQLLAAIAPAAAIVGPVVTVARPSCGPVGAMPPISNPSAAVHALVEFFQAHHMLTRDDFLMLISKSQQIAPRS